MLAAEAARRAQEVAYERALELLAVQDCIHSPLLPSVCPGYVALFLLDLTCMYCI